METHEEDDIDELMANFFTFPPDVQAVIEQVIIILLHCYSFKLCRLSMCEFSMTLKSADI